MLSLWSDDSDIEEVSCSSKDVQRPVCGAEDDVDIAVVSTKLSGPKPPDADRHVDPGFVRKEIIPPVNGKKGFQRRQIIKTSKPTTRSKTKSDRDKDLVKCPICSGLFIPNEVQNHASTCGLTSKLVSVSNLRTENVCENNAQGSSKITRSFGKKTVKCTFCRELVMKDKIAEHALNCTFSAVQPIETENTSLIDLCENNAEVPNHASTCGLTSELVSVSNLHTENLCENNAQVSSTITRSFAKKTVKCPICRELVLKDKIEEHASTCGLTSELPTETENTPLIDLCENYTEVPSTSSTYKSEIIKIECPICKAQVLKTEIEQHAWNCCGDSDSVIDLSYISNDTNNLEDKCPICEVLISKNEIIEHVSTCGLIPDVENQARNPKISLKDSNDTETCFICDSVLNSNTDYEVHVKACIAIHSQN